MTVYGTQVTGRRIETTVAIRECPAPFFGNSSREVPYAVPDVALRVSRELPFKPRTRVLPPSTDRLVRDPPAAPTDPARAGPDGRLARRLF